MKFVDKIIANSKKFWNIRRIIDSYYVSVIYETDTFPYHTFRTYEYIYFYEK